jgi:hypothetical protein
VADRIAFGRVERIATVLFGHANPVADLPLIFVHDVGDNKCDATPERDDCPPWRHFRGWAKMLCQGPLLPEVTQPCASACGQRMPPGHYQDQGMSGKVCSRLQGGPGFLAAPALGAEGRPKIRLSTKREHIQFPVQLNVL